MPQPFYELFLDLYIHQVTRCQKQMYLFDSYTGDDNESNLYQGLQTIEKNKFSQYSRTIFKADSENTGLLIPIIPVTKTGITFSSWYGGTDDDCKPQRPGWYKLW